MSDWLHSVELAFFATGLCAAYTLKWLVAFISPSRTDDAQAIKSLKRLLLVMGAAAVVTILYKFLSFSQMSLQETNLYAFLLTGLSALVSWFLSAYYSQIDGQQKAQNSIDRIGERSAEKVLNQSKQIFDIETYLREEMGADVDSASSRVDLVLDSTQRQLAIVRSSNDLYVNDWLGVLSDEVRERIKAEVAKQREQFSKAEQVWASATSSEELLNELRKEPGPFAPSAPRKSHYEDQVVFLREQSEHKQTSDEVSGTAIIDIVARVSLATAVCRFDPPLSVRPRTMEAQLVSGPCANGDVRIKASIHPNLKNFPIHINPTGEWSYLPPGEYRVHYRYSM